MATQPQFKSIGVPLFKSSGVPAMDPNCCCVETGCCPSNVLPLTLFATFGGVLSTLGTVTLTYNTTNLRWENPGASLTACGEDGGGDGIDVIFECAEAPPGTFFWHLTIVGFDVDATNWVQDSVTCDPFDWDATDTVVAGSSCSGTATVSITE